MTPQQLFQLVWLPGLSTAEKVSEVSGRGVGMDVVRSKVEELNGTVDLESESGRGTTVLIRLPLTLAILPSLMVEIERDVFAVPLESVAEIVSIGRREMATVGGRRTALVRQRVVPIVTIDGIFNARQAVPAGGRPSPRPAGGTPAPQPDRQTLVLLGQEEERQLGLTVDRVLGEEEVVVKSIAANYRHVAGIAGATIFGDGRVALILDPPTLIEMTSHCIPAVAV
jgi:two-component system chemotaxis sensor kinase CheA